MRILVPAALLCALSTPAFAQEKPAPDKAEAVVRAMRNPMMQGAAAAVLGNFADIILDTRVGPVAGYADPDGRTRAEDTLGDVARRHDPDFDKHLRDGTRRGVAAAATLANDALDMRNELARTGSRLHAAAAPLLAMLSSMRTE
jgi:hypothetical protein